MSYCYRSYAEIAADVRDWSSRLPSSIIAVCGIPRSGTLIAAMLSQHRNVHLVTPEQLLAGDRPWERPLRRRVPARGAGFVLVVDDTCWSGRTIPLMRQQLASVTDVEFRFGALYTQPSVLNRLDYHHRLLTTPRHSFEHNFGHDIIAKHVLFDLDGTLCEDWTFPGEEGEYAECYQQHLEQARPLFLPSTQILAVCTARLEKYRPQTEAWLKRHGIEFEVVHMCRCQTPAERAAYGFARFKAEYYKLRRVAHLFVENDPRQAEEIHRLTGKPVLIFPQRQMLGGVEPLPPTAPVQPDGGWHRLPRPALDAGPAW